MADIPRTSIVGSQGVDVQGSVRIDRSAGVEADFRSWLVVHAATAPVESASGVNQDVSIGGWTMRERGSWRSSVSVQGTGTAPIDTTDPLICRRG